MRAKIGGDRVRFSGRASRACFSEVKRLQALRAEKCPGAEIEESIAFNLMEGCGLRGFDLFAKHLCALLSELGSRGPKLLFQPLTVVCLIRQA